MEYESRLIIKHAFEVNMSQPEKNEIDEAKKKLFRKEVADFFGEKWLNTEGKNPVQITWKRKDAFAEMEVITLGDCLNVLKKDHRKWILDNIQTIKSNELNNARGAIFEVLLAGYQKKMEMENHSFEVIPARQHQKGYDVSLKFKDDFVENISIKWLASSRHNDVFQEKMKKLESKIKEAIKKFPRYSFHVSISLGKYPSNAQDWSKIENKTIKSFEKSSFANYMYDDDFIKVKVYTVTHHKNMKLYSGKQSYSFIVFSPYHKNEEDNIFSKMQKAAHTTNKNSPESSNMIKNTCFIRIPNFVDPDLCRKICIKNKEIMEYNNLQLIFFYNATIGTQLEENESYIMHNFSIFITNINQLISTTKNHTTGLSFPCGYSSDQYYVNKLVNERGETFSLANKYIYQSGKCFIDYGDHLEGRKCFIDTDPDGIETYYVVQIPGGSVDIAAYKGTGELFLI